MIRFGIDAVRVCVYSDLICGGSGSIRQQQKKRINELNDEQLKPSTNIKHNK